MSNKPYPGYPPSYGVVDSTAGFNRTCFVIEFLSLGQIDNIGIAVIKEKLEACIERLKEGMVIIEKVQLVSPDQFDPVLKQGLRVS